MTYEEFLPHVRFGHYNDPAVGKIRLTAVLDCRVESEVEAGQLLQLANPEQLFESRRDEMAKALYRKVFPQP